MMSDISLEDHLIAYPQRNYARQLTFRGTLSVVGTTDLVGHMKSHKPLSLVDISRMYPSIESSAMVKLSLNH